MEGLASIASAHRHATALLGWICKGGVWDWCWWLQSQSLLARKWVHQLSFAHGPKFFVEYYARRILTNLISTLVKIAGLVWTELTHSLAISLKALVDYDVKLIIDECSPNPCQNGGICTDRVGTYSCNFPPEYTGRSCETGTDDHLPNPCDNGPICMDGLSTLPVFIHRDS